MDVKTPLQITIPIEALAPKAEELLFHKVRIIQLHRLELNSNLHVGNHLLVQDLFKPDRTISRITQIATARVQICDLLHLHAALVCSNLHHLEVRHLQVEEGLEEDADNY